MQQKETKEKDRQKWLILLLLLITLAAVGIAIWALRMADSDRPLPPDFAPDDEAYAQEIPNDSGEKNDAAEGGGKVSLTYSNEVVMDLSDGTASLLFANPKRSSHDVILQITVRDTVVVQSGLLKAGTQVKTLELLPEAVDKLESGGYHGSFFVFCYDPITGEQAVVNTEIPITVIVRN
ncbi:MAG: hypothetical protein IJA67_09240 [Oscillospiraceae bacterium]|nr:hypothetical protein [Oscillospiraceae bacterium]